MEDKNAPIVKMGDCDRCGLFKDQVTGYILGHAGGLQVKTRLCVPCVENLRKRLIYLEEDPGNP